MKDEELAHVELLNEVKILRARVRELEAEKSANANGVSLFSESPAAATRFQDPVRLKCEKEFYQLFEDAPIAMIVLDASRVKDFLNGLKLEGRAAFQRHFDEHPDDVQRCSELMKTVHMNKAMMAWYRPDDAEVLIKNRIKIASPQLLESFKEALIAIAMDQIKYDAEYIDYNVAGKLQRIRSRGVKLPGYERSYERLLAAMLDSTPYGDTEADRQQEHERMVQKNRFSSLGVLVAGVAHEINNPNNFIMMNASLLQAIWEPILVVLEEHCQLRNDLSLGNYDLGFIRERLPRLLAEINNGSRRIKSIVEELKNFVREGSDADMLPLQANQVVKAAVTITGSRIAQATGDFRIRLAPDLPLIKGNFQRLEQVIINLLLNACEALTNRSQIIEIETSQNSETNRVEIKISDQGCGIPPDIIHRLPEPFFTTKRTEGGSGLGLAISSTIIEEHNGALRLSARSAGGTSVMVTLPAMFEAEVVADKDA